MAQQPFSLLPRRSCRTNSWLLSHLVGRKRTANMTEQLIRGLAECLTKGVHICEQKLEVSPLVIMCDHSSRDTPEPFNAVGIGIIGRRINEIQLLLELGEHATHQEGTSGSVCLEIVSNHDGDAPTTFRASHRGAHLRDITHRRCASERFYHRTTHLSSPPGRTHRPCGYL